MVSTRKPARARASGQPFGVVVDNKGVHAWSVDIGDGPASNCKPLNDGDRTSGEQQKRPKRLDRPYYYEEGEFKELDWFKSKTARLAAGIPFKPCASNPGRRGKIKAHEARERAIQAVQAARNAMHLAFGQKRGLENAISHIIEVSYELGHLRENGSDALAISTLAYKGMIYTKSMLRIVHGVVDEGMPEKGMHRAGLPSFLSRSGLERNVALLECLMRDGSCLSEWLEQVEKLTGRGRGSTYEIDTFVRSLVLFWQQATGKLPTKNVPETLSTDGRFCDFYHFLSAASQDLGMKQKADRRVREVLKQLDAERKAARNIKAQRNKLERVGLSPEARAERRRIQKQTSRTNILQSRRLKAAIEEENTR